MFNATNTRILTQEFDYERPTSLEEVFAHLKQHGSEAGLIAGGTDILVQMKLERKTPSVLVSLAKVPELEGISAGDGLTIGANTSIRTLANDEVANADYRALTEACHAFSTVPIMIMGTLGGNLCNASPASDSAPALIAFEASVNLASDEGERNLPLEEFFTGPGKTVLREGEILKSVQIPATAENTGSAFLKVARVVADISQVCTAVKLVRDGDRITDCRIALGSVAPTTMRAKQAEEMLANQTPTAELLDKVAEMVSEEVTPITDPRATKEYRKHISGVIVRDALKTAWQRAGGGSIE